MPRFSRCQIDQTNVWGQVRRGIRDQFHVTRQLVIIICSTLFGVELHFREDGASWPIFMVAERQLHVGFTNAVVVRPELNLQPGALLQRKVGIVFQYLSQVALVFCRIAGIGKKFRPKHSGGQVPQMSEHVRGQGILVLPSLPNVLPVYAVYHQVSPSALSVVLCCLCP